MGLPLFIAPVESDVKNGDARKLTTSPPRTSIRRSGQRQGPRPTNRPTARRQNPPLGARLGRGQRVRIAADGPSDRNTTQPNGGLLDDVGAGDVGVELRVMEPMPFDGDSSSVRMREVLREMNWTDSPERPTHDSFMAGWSASRSQPFSPGEPRVNGARDHLHRLPRSTARPGRTIPPYLPGPSDPSVGEHSDRVPRYLRRSPPLSVPISQSNTTTRYPPMITASGRPTPRGQRFFETVAQRQAAYGRGQNAERHGGLGDRDRSLSPETWDTLLTTLAPDPQPPSASSSFASGAPSQSAGPSTNTTPPTEPMDEDRADANCDSGREQSDDEDEETRRSFFSGRGLPPPAARMHPVDTSRQRSAAQRLTDGLVNARRAPRRLVGPRHGPHAGTLNELNEWVDGWHVEQLASGDLTPDGPVEGPSAGPFTFAEDTSPVGEGGSWFGELSVGASDGPGDAPGPAQTVTGSELSGMQRIVRNMALREDIPDEWWAQAGLSRSLPRGS